MLRSPAVSFGLQANHGGAVRVELEANVLTESDSAVDVASGVSDHARSADAVAARLGSDAADGLSDTAAGAALERWGPNEIASAPPVPVWRRFLDQFKNAVVGLLLAAIVVSLAVWWAEGAEGLPLDALVIALIVVVNAVVGFLQEYRAGQAVQALRDMTRSEATVVRGGATRRVAAAELVPGDVIVLADGDIVPADARLVEVGALKLAEAALTGESAPVAKGTEPVSAEAELGDRTSMVYRGTIVVSGSGRAVVTATGVHTEVGRIADLLERTEREPTPLQREIDTIGRVLGIAVVVIAMGVVAALAVVDGMSTTADVLSALLIAVSLAVAAVPEGLPAVLSVVLALGVQRMSQRNALVKQLVSVEALGSASVICSDKTGTLTRNEMAVREVVVPSGTYPDHGDTVLDEVRWLLTVGSLACDRRSDNGIGDPTELAVLSARAELGVGADRLDERFELREVLPFSSERRRMSVVLVDHGDNDRLVVATKGAPDVLIDRCRYELVDGRRMKLTEERRQWWLAAVHDLADRAMRTLSVVYRVLEPGADLADHDEDTVERDLVMLGVLGIIDPPRPETADAVAEAHRAGIRTIMITGDHPATAASIADQLGVAGGSEPVTGARLARADDRELVELVAGHNVFARVAPEHKLRIVTALLAEDEIVAMTGDGVNDAPALKAASIGVAMGRTGSDVSKEAADMILTDDNYATIVAAVREGRAIFHNIRSFLRYLLSSNIGEVLAVFLGVIGASALGLSDAAGPATPLLAVHILWINLVTDAGPALALGVDPPPPGLMRRPPRRLHDRVIDRSMQIGIGIVGLTTALSTLAALDLRLPGGLLGGDGTLDEARTMAFTTLVLAQLFNTVNARSDTDSAFLGNTGRNHWLGAAVAVSLLLQVAVVHLPFLNTPFRTVPLSPTDWVVAMALASSVLWVGELRKLIGRRRRSAPTAIISGPKLVE